MAVYLELRNKITCQYKLLSYKFTGYKFYHFLSNKLDSIEIHISSSSCNSNQKIHKNALILLLPYVIFLSKQLPPDYSSRSLIQAKDTINLRMKGLNACSMNNDYVR